MYLFELLFLGRMCYIPEHLSFNKKNSEVLNSNKQNQESVYKI